MGNEVAVKIIKIDPSARKIGLSLKTATVPSEVVPSNNANGSTKEKPESQIEGVTLAEESNSETKE